MRPLTVTAWLFAGLFAGAVQAQRSEDGLRRDLERTWIHGIAENDARALASEADVSTLLALLGDPGFERPDNAAAFLVHLAGEESAPALMALARRSIASAPSPESDRARLLLPQVLAAVAGRSGGAGLEGLLELAGDEESFGELAGLAASELVRIGLPRSPEPPRLIDRSRPTVADGSQLVHGIPLSFANHVDLDSPIDSARLDLALHLANVRVGRSDFEGDVSCCIQAERSGAPRVFGTRGDGLDIIDDAAEFNAVRNEASARVKVVRLIRHCFGNDSPNIGGCAEISGDSMVVVRFGSATVEGLVWLHEYGHNTGIAQHSADDRFIMSPITGLQDVAVSAGECAKFHQPEPGTQIVLLNRGPCQDLDEDEVHDSIDNCPSVANKDQSDQDFDGAGDACDGDDDGDGVPDEDDRCPGIPDGEDLDGDGVPACLDACPEDPLKIAPGACGCGIVDVDTDLDGVVDCLESCPLDPFKLLPGLCGCGVSDADSDLDGVPDCHDACPLDASKTEEGACGCGLPEGDSDGDGIADCHDLCPLDPAKTSEGACGCGLSDEDSDGDGIADCVDLCPLSPGKNSAGDCGCGLPELDADRDGIVDCLQCTLGDAWPPEGDGRVTLADWVALRRRVAGVTAGSARCLDLAPALVNLQASSLCPGGGDGLDAEDARLLRALASGVAELDCELGGGAEPPGAGARRAGDVAPLAAQELGDGVVDVSDVLQLLRWSVFFEPAPTGEALLRGDVAPFMGDSVAGDRRVDVSDVLLTLRAVVGLARLQWPLRIAQVELEVPIGAVASLVRLEELPPFVEPLAEQDFACSFGGAGGVDARPSLAAVSCSWDPFEFVGRQVVAAFAYRAPEALALVGPEAPLLSAEAVDAALDPVGATARLLAGD